MRETLRPTRHKIDLPPLCEWNKEFCNIAFDNS